MNQTFFNQRLDFAAAMGCVRFCASARMRVVERTPRGSINKQVKEQSRTLAFIEPSLLNVRLKFVFWSFSKAKTSHPVGHGGRVLPRFLLHHGLGRSGHRPAQDGAQRT
jgi:hypothetical protein